MPRPSRRKRVESKPAPGVRSLSLDGGSSSAYTGSLSLPTGAGPVVTEHTSLAVAAFWQGVKIYADSIASVGFQVNSILPRGGLEPDRESPIYDLIACEPDDDMSSFSFRHAGMNHLFTRGNWYAEIVRDRYKIPVALHLLDPRNVKPQRDKAGKLQYELIREKTVIPARDMVHVAGMGWDGIQGYSVVAMARETIGLAIAEQSYTAHLMGNSAAPQGHLEYPGKLPDKTKGTLRDQWNKVHQGADRAGNISILDGGLKWVIESFSPADTELILSRKFSIAEVARILGLPQYMLGLFDGATFSNIEQLNIQFYRLSLTPQIHKIEAEFNRKLLTPEDRRTHVIKLDAGDFLKGDTAAQIALRRFLFDTGAASPNENRLYFGMTPIDDDTADKNFIPGNNLVALQDIDKVAPKAAPAPDPAAEPAPARSVILPIDPTQLRLLAVDRTLEAIA